MLNLDSCPFQIIKLPHHEKNNIHDFTIHDVLDDVPELISNFTLITTLGKNHYKKTLKECRLLK